MDGGDLNREEVLKRDIPWETYMTAKMISGTGFQLLRRYDHRSKEVQASLLEDDGPAYLKTFVSVLRNVTKDETIEYTLALIDELLSLNPNRARFFLDHTLAQDDVYGTFLRFITKQKWLLSRKKWFIMETTCKILTLTLSYGRKKNGLNSLTSYGVSEEEYTQILGTFIDWLCGQLRQPSHPTRSAPTAISALAVLLRDSLARSIFVKADGVKLLTPLISPASSQQYMQLLYETVLCVWLLSFYDEAAKAIAPTRIVPRLVDVAKSSSKIKVVRVAIMALCNLHNKETFSNTMVELGLPKIVQAIKLQDWPDEDLMEALDTLEADLRAKIKVLSSFDKYKQEVLSGTLDWTPMHKDPTFWRENIMRFEDNDFQVLRVLVTLLDTSRDPKTLAIAAHDVGQFIQNHPSGRIIALDLKAKDKVMALMSQTDPEVRKQALLCVQKLLLSSKYISFMQ